jgi:hypothetical protein
MDSTQIMIDQTVPLLLRQRQWLSCVNPSGYIQCIALGHLLVHEEECGVRGVARLGVYRADIADVVVVDHADVRARGRKRHAGGEEYSEKTLLEAHDCSRQAIG